MFANTRLCERARSIRSCPPVAACEVEGFYADRPDTTLGMGQDSAYELEVLVAALLLLAYKV